MTHTLETFVQNFPQHKQNKQLNVFKQATTARFNKLIYTGTTSLFCNKKHKMCNLDWNGITQLESSTKFRKAVVITWPHHVMRRRLGLDRVSSFPTCSMDSVSTLPRHRRRYQKIGTLFLSIWIGNKGMRFSQGRTSHALIISKDILQVGRGQRKPQQDDQHWEQVDERKWGPLYGCLWRWPTLTAMRTGIQEWDKRQA